MINKKPKIFIICGKARTGKDTIASIIKDDFKDLKVLNLQYSSYIKDYVKTISDWDGKEEDKPRNLLQSLGTDIRENIDEYFFVRKIIDDIKVYSYFFDVITVSDARFKTEIDLPREKFDNVFTIKVERPNFDNGLTFEQKEHQTEVALDDYNNYDYKIINDGNIEELRNKIRDILKEVHHES